MALVVDIASWALLMTGVAFALIGGVGILRLPELFTRMHAAGVTDTLGAGLILIGLALQAGFTLITVKLLMIFVLLIFTSPTATHALAKAALHGGLKPLPEAKDKTP